jgi:hypothetical protein
LPNKNKTQLHSDRIAYAGNVNDVPANAKDTGAFKKNPAGFEYHQPVNQFIVALLMKATGEKAPQAAPPVILPYINAPFQPPQG